ncbi:MAG: FliM/FliN family flagellar motor switch protein [Acidobacteria bacterium]|nr:FliM/FliN family flagellar motor switch protein [Acidobacteriota bacterium]
MKRAEKVDSEKAPTFEGAIRELMPFINTPFRIEIELGRARLNIRDLLELDVGSLVELKKSAGEPMDVLCKDRVIIRGEVTVLEDNLGLRVTEIVDSDRKI